MKLGNNVRFFHKYYFCVFIIFASVITQLISPVITHAADATFSVSGNITFNIPETDGETSYGPVKLALLPHGSPQADNNGPIATTEAEKTTPKKGSTSVKIPYSFTNVPVPSFFTTTITVCLNNSSNFKTAICSSAVTYSKDTLKYTKVNLALTDEEVTASQNAGTIPGLNADESSDSTDKTSCAINGVGWIICPVMKFMAYVVDGAYAMVSKLLTTQPLNISTDDSNTMYQAWSAMRSIANVAFIIGFMIIIFSQVTTIGITNYGIKKMLPKLIIAAILVNASYFICAALIDISNIAGSSLKGFFDSIGAKIESPTVDGTSAWTKVLETILFGGLGVAILYSSLAALIPALLAAMVAIVTVFLVLSLRQALLIILVVISPLAFVAYFLPNTEGIFKKWRELMKTLLLMFPLISIIFGASALASKIIIDNADGSLILQIMGALISIIPLALTPIIMKVSGGILSKFGLMTGGLTGKLTKGYENSGLNRHLMAKKADKAARVSAGNYRGSGGMFNPSNVRSRFNKGLNSNRAFNTMTGGYGAQRSLAAQMQDKKDTQEAMALFNGNNKFAESWIKSKGDRNSAEYLQMNSTDKAQFDKLVYAGHAKKATSQLAAAKMLSENGKADGKVVRQAIVNASNLGSDSTDTTGATHAAIAAFKSSGRGDAVAELNTLSYQAGVAGAVNMTNNEGWDKVNASAVSFAIKPGDIAGVAARNSGYDAYVAQDAAHVQTALEAYSRMSAESQKEAMAAILKAANLHHPQGLQGAQNAPLRTIQDAKAAFGIR